MNANNIIRQKVFEAVSIVIVISIVIVRFPYLAPFVTFAVNVHDLDLELFNRPRSYINMLIESSYMTFYMI